MLSVDLSTVSIIQSDRSNKLKLKRLFLEKTSQLQFQDTYVSINSGQYSCLVDNLGNFRVEVPSTGNYKLEVFNLNYHFEPVIVEIYDEEFAPGKNTKAFLFNIKTEKDFRLVYPLQLDPSSRI